ncbi:MAG TPA: hypothetical protein GX524_02675 [Firmicutes bacterium]|jgi:hypothetical protein|nr:hypothetical protein [Bacillota bacterium]
MHTPVELQLWRVSILCLSGIVFNILFRAYTALRAVVSPGKITRHIFDTLMAALVLSVLACVVFIANYGEMRLYIPVSISAGFLIANTLVGNLVYTVALSCFKTIKNLVHTVVKRVLAPLKNLLFRPTPPGNGTDGNKNSR